MISIWEKETFFAPQDVLIAGGGFVGLWSAYFIKKKHPHATVTLLDRGLIPTGASTRNAGFACFGSLSEIMYDIQTMGLDKTVQLVEMRYKGLQKIVKHFGKKAVDFGWCGGYELFQIEHSTGAKLEEDMQYLNAILKPITATKNTYKKAVDKIKKFGFGSTDYMVKNSLEGYLHSGKLVQALLHKVQGMGVQVFNSVAINGFENTSGRITVHTDKGISFSAAQLLVCTNAFANELLPQAAIVPARGQVLLTSPIKDLPWNGTFHYDEGYYYFRNLGNKVLLGGARNKAFDNERTLELSTSDEIQTELERFLAEVVLPHHKGQYLIEQRWSGIMGMGSEKMPTVAEVQPQIFCALGTGGMGVALAPVMGQQAAQLLF